MDRHRHPSTTELHTETERESFVHVLVVAFGAPESELGRRFPIVDELLIGRSSPNFESASKTMSRQHAEVKRQGGALVVRDLGSRKGTFVNGERVQKRPLAAGDVIVAGGVGFVVAWAPALFVPTRSAKAQPPVAFESLAMARAIAEVEAAARTAHPVALVGEPGVGKRLLAEVLHRASGTKGALHVVDAASLEEAAWPAEQAPGAIDTVLFARMSEAGEPVVRLCVDLLRKRERGASAPRLVIALGAAADGTPVVPEALAEYFDGTYVRIPSLSERVEDIMPIARQRLATLAKRPIAIGPTLALRLLRRRWTGNVRGLLAEVDRAWSRADAASREAGLVEDLQPDELREVCKIARDASYVESAFGERTSLERRRVLRSLLRALLEGRAQPGAGLDAWALAKAGWPDEQMSATSASNRVYVAVATLRKLGLGRSLVFADGGYRLADDDTVRVVAPELPGDPK